MNSKKWIKKIIRVMPIIGLVLLFFLAIYGYHLGIFKSVNTLQHYIQKFGNCAILVFIVFQTVQVIVPILPGGTSCLVGLLLFGNFYGFLYNYIGIIFGEIVGFFLARHYGNRFIQLVLPEKTFKKYTDLLSQNDGSIKKFLIIVLIIPFAPDDVACLISGLSNIKFNEYIKIILPLKIWSIGIYGFILLKIANNFIH